MIAELQVQRSGMEKLRSVARQFVNLEFYLVAPLLATGILREAWLPWALLGAGLFWPLRRLTTGRWSARTPADWPGLIVLFMLPLTLWATSNPEKTLPQVLRLLAGAALFYSVVNWANRSRRLRLICNFLLAAGCTLAIAAPFIVQWDTVKSGSILSILYANFQLLAQDPVNPNVMAGSLALLLPISLGMLLLAWHSLAGWEKLLTGSFIFLGGAILILTQSLGAWLAILTALAVLAAFYSRWGWVVGFAVMALGAALVGGQAGSLAGLLAGNPNLGSLDGRLEVWSRAIFMLQDFPFTGVGMGAFGEAADRLYPFLGFAPGTIEHAHNLFLQVGVDLGIPGLVAWLAIFMGLSYAAWWTGRSARRRSEATQITGHTAGQLAQQHSQQFTWHSGLAAGLLASQAALLIHGLSDAVTWGMVRPAPLVWLIWGLIATEHNLPELHPDVPPMLQHADLEI